MNPLVKIFFPIALIMTTALNATVSGGIKTTVKTGVSTCTQKNSKCAVTVNAIGEMVDLDVNRMTAQDLGTITEEKKVTIDLPKEPNSTKLYSLTPTTGESNNEKIFIVFRNIPQPEGSRLFGQTVIIAYRQFAGDKSTQWTEVGRINSNVTLESAEVTLMPDGTAKVADPKKPAETVIFAVAQKVFR